MRRALLAGTAFFAATLAAVSSWAQQPAVAVESGSLSSIPSALLGDALTVSILASLGKPSEPPRWEAKDVKYTIPGTPVSIKMLGSEAVIVITLTPYKNASGGLLLVAQAQVWYKDGDAGLSYRTTVDTLVVAFGERVLFYPFGAHPDVGSPLRVELIMNKYLVDNAVPGAATISTEAAPPSDQAKEKTKP